MKKIIVFLCIFWMGFIFYMSSINGEISHQESKKIVNLIESNMVDKQINEKNKMPNMIKENQIKENKLDYIVRKNAHAFLYMILGILVAKAAYIFNKLRKDTVGYILFVCLFYAVTDEFHQSFIPGRTSLVSDILVDFIGTLFGLIIFYLVCCYRDKRRKDFM